MDITRNEQEVLGRQTLEQAHQTYRQLTEEVERWQEERGAFWKKELSPAENSPYFPSLDLPERAVFEIWDRLNQVLGVIVSEATLKANWEEVKLGRPVSGTELLSNLQLALGGVAQISRQYMMEMNKNSLKGLESENLSELNESICPICGNEASLSFLSPPNGQRFLHCTLCGYDWPTKRVGCVHCGGNEASEQTYLHSEEFPGIEMVVCEACGQYVKELDFRVLVVEDFIWEDIRTLQLNYAAEKWLADYAMQSGKVQ